MQIVKKIRSFSLYSLAHPYIRFAIGYLRFRFLVVFYGIRTLESEYSVRNTLSHNLSALAHIVTDFSMIRMEKLIYALLAVEKVNRESRILVIGPRTESDILRLKGLGIKHVLGLDIISYSPWIRLGDMHDMPFEESQFDAVVIGWTVSYSKDPPKVAREIIRVLRPGGVVAIGVDHFSYEESRLASPTQFRQVDSVLVDGQEENARINSADNVLGLFGMHVDNVYFNNNAPLSGLSAAEIYEVTGLSASLVMMVFDIKKPG